MKKYITSRTPGTRSRRRLVGITVVLAAIGLGSTAMGALDTNDTRIINLYLLNEATSGQLDNLVLPAFVDSAPTGTPQNHDNFNDDPSDGPAWGSSTSFESGGSKVGTGTGLIFTRSDNDRTRFSPWMGTNQGIYSNGKSFTVMMRLYATELIDGTNYRLMGIGSHFLSLQGASGGGTSRIDAQIRDGGGAGGETFWTHNSFSGTGDTIFLNGNTWYNLFMIYDADSSLTIATDDGATFKRATSTSVPADFSSLTDGFADPLFHWSVGNNNLSTGSFDGRIESITFWDRALSLSEADSIDLLTVPEPGSAALVWLALVFGWRFVRRTS